MLWRKHNACIKTYKSVFDSCKQDRGVETLTGRTCFVSEDDSLVLEDESARMALRGQGIDVGRLVTGVVAAVRGVSAANGEFHVKVGRSSVPFLAALSSLVHSNTFSALAICLLILDPSAEQYTLVPIQPHQLWPAFLHTANSLICTDDYHPIELVLQTVLRYRGRDGG